MGLFGSNKDDHGPWPVEVLTLDHRIAGELAPESRSMAWTYMQSDGPPPAGSFAIEVAEMLPTGTRATPAAVGRLAHVRDGSGLVAILPRGGRTDEEWDKRIAGKDRASATVVAGPYHLTGTLAFAGGKVEHVMHDRALHLLDVAITRTDGEGLTVTASRATVFQNHVQAVLV